MQIRNKIKNDPDTKLDELDAKSNVAIIMHKSPDPDAIGSAVGMELYCKTLGYNPKIYYDGEISHPENKALMNVLNFSFRPVSEFKKENSDYIITVDCTESNTGIPDLKADLIIDHHRVTVDENQYDEGSVIIEQIGSASTLVYKYFVKRIIESIEEVDRVATALLFGIIKDTDNFLSDNTTNDDFDAHRDLVQYSNKQYIFEIQKYPLPDYIFELESVAMDKDNFLETSGTFVTFLGKISEGKRDILPYLADKYMRKENITTSIIVAVVGKYLNASLRSTNVSVDIGETAQRIFGSEYAGGKSRYAGADVPLDEGYLNIVDDDDMVDEIIQLIKKKVLSAVKKEVSRES